MSTTRNPDLIIPGGALKGNTYFKQKVGEPLESSIEKGSDSDTENDAFSKLKN
jgi:hypothetical protein